MRRFPNGVRKVTPLYTTSADQSRSSTPASISSQRPKFAFNYQSALKIIRSSMYEPVADRCANTIINPKYLERDADEQMDEQPPPEKPPRRNKLRRQQSRHDSHQATPNHCLNSSNMKSSGNGEACIDIDQISLEANNYKNKFANATVQTSPPIPYRLRFWPKTDCDFKCDPNAGGCTKVRFACLCRVLSQWILSQIGLTIVVVLWALLGALAFYRTEGPRELEQFEQLGKLQNDLSIDLATELRQSGEVHQEAWPNKINKYLEKHETMILEAVSAGFGEGGGGSIWTYPGCILFAISLLTTLGFGAPVPRTSLGRGAAVLFSAVGIPLHFLLVLNVGSLGATALRRLAAARSALPAAPRWLRLLPFAAPALYYLLGVALFGLARRRPPADCLMFPLDFTAAGGVATTHGHVRVLYGLYLEGAVTLAALVVSLMQAAATRGVVELGLRLGLLTNA